MREKSDRRMDKKYVNVNFILCRSSLQPALLYRRNYTVGHVVCVCVCGVAGRWGVWKSQKYLYREI